MIHVISMEFSLRVDFSPSKLPERRGSRRDSCTLWSDKLLKLWDVSQLKIDVFLAAILIGSTTSRCSGKWGRTHPPKERLNACYFLCWFKPIMLPPADSRLAKIVTEIITSKQKVLPWSIAWGSDFDGAETLGEIVESEGTQRFVRLFVVNDCVWRDFASSRIFSRRFKSR